MTRPSIRLRLTGWYTLALGLLLLVYAGATFLAPIFEDLTAVVCLSGTPLSHIGIRAYREQVAAVMQEDHLLSGSIADNICFFDTSFDQERMMACAQLARIHDEILVT